MQEEKTTDNFGAMDHTTPESNEASRPSDKFTFNQKALVGTLFGAGGQSQNIAKKWDNGSSMVSKGDNMKSKGQKNIIDGKALIAKGEKMITDGDKMIVNGKKEMADAESSYETLRANPVPLSTPTAPTTP